MLTQIDVSRLPSYQWGREDARNEFKTLLAETDSVLQEKENLLKQALQEKDQQTLSMIELARLTRKNTYQDIKKPLSSPPLIREGSKKEKVSSCSSPDKGRLGGVSFALRARVSGGLANYREASVG